MKTKNYRITFSVTGDQRQCWIELPATSKPNAIDLAKSCGPESFSGGDESNPPDQAWWNAAKPAAHLV